MLTSQPIAVVSTSPPPFSSLQSLPYWGLCRTCRNVLSLLDSFAHQLLAPSPTTARSYSI